MNKNEYVTRLSSALDRYEVKNKFDILADYEQIIDEILLDNDDDFNSVIEKLGYPEILGIEIADELGYETKKDQPKQFKEGNTSNTFNKKRYKSNVVWSVLIWLYGIVQFFLTTLVIVGIVFVAYFGFNSTLNVNNSIDNNMVTTQLEICGYNGCQNFESNAPAFSGYHHDYNRFLNNDEINIYIGPIACAATIIIIVLIWFNYFLIYRNIRRVINNNNEYNRRRQYE